MRCMLSVDRVSVSSGITVDTITGKKDGVGTIYYADGEAIALVRGDESRPAEANRFEVEHSFRAAGTYEIQVKAHVLGPPRNHYESSSFDGVVLLTFDAKGDARKQDEVHRTPSRAARHRGHVLIPGRAAPTRRLPCTTRRARAPR